MGDEEPRELAMFLGCELLRADEDVRWQVEEDLADKHRSCLVIAKMAKQLLNGSPIGGNPQKY
jgi:hypothetical protein